MQPLNVIATQEAICAYEIKRLTSKTQIASKMPTHNTRAFFRNDVANFQQPCNHSTSLRRRKQSVTMNLHDQFNSQIASKMPTHYTRAIFRNDVANFNNHATTPRHCDEGSNLCDELKRPFLKHRLLQKCQHTIPTLFFAMT